MFCKNCGRQIPDDATFCPSCGTKKSSGSNTFGEERSGSDMKNLPNYAKENDLRKTGAVIDSDRKKFSLTGDDRKTFSLSDGGTKKPFSLSKQPDEPKHDDGFVRANPATQTVAPPPPMKPAPTMAKPEPATIPSKPAEPEKPAAGVTRLSTDVSAFSNDAEPTGFVNPLKDRKETSAFSNDAEPTGFVNPLKGQSQEIHWGSDGDRNAQNGGKPPIDPGAINSHMGFAIFCTLCCCLPTGIAAIVFASQVSKHLKDGNYEQAQKSADNAQLLCWISVGMYFLSSAVGGIMSALGNLLGAGTP